MKTYLPKKFAWSLILVVVCSLSIQAQDIHFSQFFETPLLRNPSLAGIFKGDIRAQMVYRNQWNNITDAYRTASFNFEYKKPIGRADDFLTIGAQVMYDKAGTIALTSTHILPVLNYQKSLSADRNMYLSLGFMGGLVQRRIDESKITTNSQYNGQEFDPGLSNGESFTQTSYSYLDASVGMSFNSQLGANENNNFYLGLAYHHFNKSNKTSFYGNINLEMVPKWVASLGIRMNVSEESYFTLYGDYSKQDVYTETVAGFIYSYRLGDPEDPRYVLHIGSMVRLKDALIPVLKLDIGKMAVSGSYDVNTSQLRNASYGRGGFEFALSYQNFNNKDNSSRDAVRCPVF
ncbi:MAG: PorP/SprF family type IX secretion system membrane protein [Chitinophagaceae bacterium]|nr:PorP/SprF family type IX secretion system membrane protein [Chitinophagaceae bacterium]